MNTKDITEGGILKIVGQKEVSDMTANTDPG